jgi:hypothetical protein
MAEYRTAHFSFASRIKEFQLKTIAFPGCEDFLAQLA